MICSERLAYEFRTEDRFYPYRYLFSGDWLF